MILYNIIVTFHLLNNQEKTSYIYIGIIIIINVNIGRDRSILLLYFSYFIYKFAYSN